MDAEETNFHTTRTTSTTVKDQLKTLLIRLIRAYIRYFPVAPGKREFWTRVVDPLFAWQPHKFYASTVFGCKMAGETRDILQQYVYYFGVWEPNLTRFIGRRLLPGDTFIDVGANVGYFSLLASTLVGGSGRVVAIEASPKLFAALRANLDRNRVHNVRAVNMTASDRRGIVRLFGGNDYHTGLTTVCEQRGLKFECEVETLPLSAILSPLEMQSARFIKIDVEGAEWSVVAGMAPLLRFGRTDLEIMVEIDPTLLAYQGKLPQDILTLFSDAGFYAYRVENDYSAESHIPPLTEQRPVRLHEPIRNVSNIIFSHEDSEYL